MALIGAESSVSAEVLQQIYSENVEGIQELTKTLDAPPFPVTDASRVMLARSFAQDIVAALTASEALRDRPSLIRRVNLSYEAMLILIDYLKTYTAGPRVPGRRAPTT
ncbi:MAG TPA: hypothetical protein VFG07_05150 [Thermoplasmata archaeon]|nr:hypothetical protein [Thermoplasmata archaeon]